MPACRRVCKHVQLKLMMEEISALAFKSQAPGSGDMLHVTCVNVGARCVLRGAGDCTMDVMFSATARRLSTSTPLKRSTATMAAIMRKSSTPLHRHTHKLSRCEKLQILRLFFGGEGGAVVGELDCYKFVRVSVSKVPHSEHSTAPGERGCRWLTSMDAQPPPPPPVCMHVCWCTKVKHNFDSDIAQARQTLVKKDPCCVHVWDSMNPSPTLCLRTETGSSGCGQELSGNYCGQTNQRLLVYLRPRFLGASSARVTANCSTDGPLSELRVQTERVLFIAARQLIWVCLHEQPADKRSRSTSYIAADFSEGWLSVGRCFWGPRAVLAVMTRLCCPGSSALVHSSVLYQELRVHVAFPFTSWCLRFRITKQLLNGGRVRVNGGVWMLQLSSHHRVQRC